MTLVPSSCCAFTSPSMSLGCCACAACSKGYDLADEALKDAFYDSQAMRDFVVIDLSRDSLPNATMLLKFRRLLLANDLIKAFIDEINAYLREVRLECIQ